VNHATLAASLPPLREELRLLPAAANHDGSPAWMVQDPVNNRFFRIGWLDFEVLLRWTNGNAKQVADSVSAETTLAADEADVGALLAFLEQHSLLKADTRQAADSLRKRALLLKKAPLQWLLHHYLFFRVPLVRPQRLLAKLLPFLAWVFTPTTLIAVALLTLTGIFLAARQWGTFISTVVDHLTWSGLVGYSIALVFAKALHEIGHALTATRYGVRVAHMGVAMLVMFPMLYTDTGESWKLTRPRQRLAIASAGIIAELALAGLATLAWSLAPEGSFKSAMFFLATTSWALTVLLNASPFMRFDGYFILSDLLDFPNLHERSGALARIWLRRTLLGFNEPWPERTPRGGNALLIGFALATWFYRLVVFLGIGLLVYYFFFKLLGIFLLGVELVWFIAMPVASELRIWIRRRNEIKSTRKIAGLALLTGLAVFALLPWQTNVHAVGWVHPDRQQQIYSPLAGKLTMLPKEGSVKQGQVVFVLESPDLQISGQRAIGLASARGNELLGLTGLPNGEERRAQLQNQQDMFLAEARLFEGEQSRMQLTAPFSGVLNDLDPQLAPGVWVQPRQPLAVIIDPSGWIAEAYVAEAEIHRVRVGDRVRLYFGLRSSRIVEGRVQEVDTARTAALPHSMLDASAGGPIATLKPSAEDRKSERAPRDALYRVRITMDSAPVGQQMMLANAVISGEGHAWLPAIFSRIAAIVIRESGF
jgi:putative peptide zinc metalloprotease protein